MAQLWKIRIWTSDENKSPAICWVLTKGMDAAEALAIAMRHLKDGYKVHRTSVKWIDEIESSMVGKGLELLEADDGTG